MLGQLLSLGLDALFLDICGSLLLHLGEGVELQQGLAVPKWVALNLAAHHSLPVDKEGITGLSAWNLT